MVTGDKQTEDELEVYSFRVCIIERKGHTNEAQFQAMCDTLEKDLDIAKRLQESVSVMLDSREATEHLRCVVEH